MGWRLRFHHKEKSGFFSLYQLPETLPLKRPEYFALEKNKNSASTSNPLSKIQEKAAAGELSINNCQTPEELVALYKKLHALVMGKEKSEFRGSAVRVNDLDKFLELEKRYVPGYSFPEEARGGDRYFISILSYMEEMAKVEETKHYLAMGHIILFRRFATLQLQEKHNPSEKIRRALQKYNKLAQGKMVYDSFEEIVEIDTELCTVLFNHENELRKRGINLPVSQEKPDDPLEIIIDKCSDELYQSYQEAFIQLGLGFIPPKHSKLNAKVLEFMQKLRDQLSQSKNSLDSIIDIACWAHTESIKLHPFGDGNGRASRLFMNLVLVENGLPPVDFSTFGESYVKLTEQARLGMPEAFKSAVRAHITAAANAAVAKFVNQDNHIGACDYTNILMRAAKANDTTAMYALFYLARKNEGVINYDALNLDDLELEAELEVCNMRCFTNSK